VNAVSVGILTARAASSYSANVATGSGSPLPAGAVVGFYQTLGARSEIPYLIEAGPIDPFNQKFVAAVGLSEGTIDSGTFVASGDNINLVSAAPREGAGKYLVAASAPSYADGKFGPTASPPASGTNPVTVTVPAVALAAGATQGSIVAEVTPATPGKYDHGQLLVSHEGQLVSQVALDAVLAQGGSVSVSVPAGSYTAMKISQHTALDLSVTVRDFSAPMNISFESTSWFARGVGMVKTVGGGELGESTTELTAYTP